jgi:tripartite ATP-independent transporter DctM subunit
MALSAGIGKKIFRVAYVVMGELRGGLAIASIAACAIFGAVCGSAVATAATIGKVAIPEMKKYNYSDTLATGSVATSGGLGVLIPPSGTFILYGILTEQSIGKLFISGIIPGILLAILFMITVQIICWRNPLSGPPGPRTTMKEKAKALGGLADTLVLFALSMGGLFAGWFSPTQAGAIGTAGAIVIGLVRRELTWKGFIEAVRDSLYISCMILFLIAGATIFGHFLAISKVSGALLTMMSSWDVAPVFVILFICFVFFILGCFVDMVAVIVLFVPIFFPLVMKLGFDPIWFGVVVTVMGIIGIVTPPVGASVYVVKGLVKDVPMETIFKGILPFLIPFIIGLLILIVFPALSTFLPSLITY